MLVLLAVTVVLVLAVSWHPVIVFVAVAATVTAAMICSSGWRSVVRPVVLSREADALAATLVEQWRHELLVRGIQRGRSLPVSWEAGGTGLGGDWSALAAWPLTGTGPARPQGAERRAGVDDDLAELLAEVPGGRLVVLGEPGAGKTVTAIKIETGLLARRLPGGQVPVLMSLASWNPAGQGLRRWIADRMELDYPALGVAVPGTDPRQTLAGALLDAGLVLPVLDGLDEIPAAARGAAVSGINADLLPSVGVIVTCRADWYTEAVRAGTVIQRSAVVRLRPLDPGVVSGYLAGYDPDPARWAPVSGVLGDASAPVSIALNTPLNVTLADAVYNLGAHGHAAGGLPDPAELLSFATAEDLRSFLFGHYLDVAYRPQGLAWRHDPRPQRFLTYLAAYLEAGQTTDLAWWELQRAVPAYVARLAGAAVSGFGAQTAPGAPPRTVIRLRELPRAVRRMPLRQQAGITLALGTGAGALGALTGGLLGLAGGAAAGAVTGVACGLPWMLGSSSRLIDEAGTSLRQDRRVAVAAGAIGATFGAALGLGATKLAGSTALGLAGGAVLGLLTAVSGTAWGRFQAARAWLAWKGVLPWRLMSFLHDAHERGVMRQNGSMYQFRHATLQTWLAGKQSAQHASAENQTAHTDPS
jgi:hypothetical protein